MFDIRLRLFTADGVKGAVLRTSSLTPSIQESGVAGLTFTVSERVAGRLVAPFVVGVEFSTGGPYVQPRNGLFIVTEEGGDSADASKTFTFTGTAFVPWLLKGMHQRGVAYTGAVSKRGEREWPNVTPGRIMRSLIDRGQSLDGWAPMLAVDFTATVDSAGVAWTAAEKWSPTFKNLVDLRSVLDAHVAAGLIDWWSEGTKLRVFRPGAGTVYPNVKLGGPGFSRMPVKRQYEDQFNHLTVVDDDGTYHYFSNPGVVSEFGMYQMTMTMSGVKPAEVERLVQPILVEGRTPRRELSYEWTPGGKLPVPWVDFQVGDAVQVRDRSGWVEQRVLGITVAKADGKVVVRATVGSKLLNRLKRAVEKVEGGSLGNMQGGTGVTVPVAPPAAVAAPKTPTGLRVVSNTATWGEDGTARTRIVLGWDEVTQAVDLSDVDGVTYEVAGRLASDAPARLTATDALTFTVEGWEPDIARYVKVRALDRAGNASEWSGEISVTPVMPSSIVPKAPTGVHQVSNVGSFRADGSAVSTVTVAWDAVTASVDNASVDVAEYEVMVGLVPIRSTGLSAVVTIPAKSTVAVTVRALTTLGVWGDPSAALNVTGAVPAGSVAAPTPPILDTGVSTVTARWDGLLTTGAPAPGFGFVYMDTAPDVDGVPGAWAPVGTPLTGAGGAPIRGHQDDTVWVRLRSTDTLGRPGGTSTAVSIVVVGTGGDDIIAGSIQVNNVSPSFGDDLNLSANEAVTIIVGQQADQATQIADLDDGVQDAQAAASAASNAAGTAQATANGAVAQAAGAAAAASDVGQRLDTHQTYYRFGVDGLAIGDPNTNAELGLAADGIRMKQNNVIVSEWVGGVFIASEVRLQSASIANHQWLPYGTGRTIVRPL